MYFVAEETVHFICLKYNFQTGAKPEPRDDVKQPISDLRDLSLKESNGHPKCKYKFVSSKYIYINGVDLITSTLLIAI